MAALATAAVVLAVGGCGTAAPGGTSGASGTSSPTTAASADPSGSTSATSAPAPAAPKTYTFPDGRLSFEYPADWRVELFTGEQKPAASGTATVFDAGGTPQATIYYGQIADGVSHPVTRTVFESAPVPGLGGQPAPAAHYSFYVDRMGDNPTYRMHLTAGAPQSGDGSALDGIIRIGDGVLVADVQFIEKPFASDVAAKSWLAGAEGQSLKALLLSISYR